MFHLVSMPLSHYAQCWDPVMGDTKTVLGLLYLVENVMHKSSSLKICSINIQIFHSNLIQNYSQRHTVVKMVVQREHMSSQSHSINHMVYKCPINV